MNWILLLPIIIPLATAAVSLLAWRWRNVQRGLAVVGTAVLLVDSVALLQSIHQTGIQAVQIGGWPAPFGITIVADLFSAIMVALTGFMGFLVMVYSLATIDEGRESYGYYPLFQILLMGVCGAFLTGDIFNLYVSFEIMLMASFVLLALGGERAQMEGAIKYVTLNLMSSAMFLAAVGILYGMMGTLNMADLAIKFKDVPQPGLVILLAMLFLIAFGIKAAVFPLFFWLPASYHTPPVAVSAIFAALLTKVGVYSLVRVFTLLFMNDTGFTHTLILAISALTMITGVLGAAAQYEFRRILSFHSISQIGYMTMGLGMFTPAALTGTVFFLLHHAIVKSNLFLVSGLTHRLQGTFDLKKMGGLYQIYPGTAILFLLPALSLAGMPPFSGFFAKYALVKAGLAVSRYAIVAVALLVSILTMFSMVKIWAEVFWKDAPLFPTSSLEIRNQYRENDTRSMIILSIPIIILAGLALFMGIAAEPMMNLANQIAGQLLNPEEYIRAVLGA